MKSKNLAIAIPSAAAILIGASALITSPVACACLSSAQIVSSSAGYDASWTEAPKFSAKQIEQGLTEHLVGQIPDKRLLFPSAEFGCKTQEQKVECFVPTHESWAISKGWRISLTKDQVGRIVAVTVSDDWSASP